MFAERLQGDTLKTIGTRHGGLSPQGVSVVVAREGKRQIDDFERRLRDNVGTGQIEALLIPRHVGADQDLALAHLRWVLSQLSERGIPIAIHYRATPSGMVFGVEIAEEAAE